MTITEKPACSADRELRQFIIPKLAEWKTAAGRFKRSECIGCQIVWKEIQGWFDKKEKKRFKLHCIDVYKDWTR